MDFLEKEYFGLPAASFLRFTILLLVGFLIKGFISKYLSKFIFKLFAARSETHNAERFADHIKRPLSSFIFVVIAYIAMMQLAPLLDQIWLFKRKVGGEEAQLVAEATKIVTIKTFSLLDLFEKVFFFLQIFIFTKLLVTVLAFVFGTFTDKAVRNGDKERQQLLPLLSDVVKVLIWTGAVFVVLGAVFSVNVAALIAGLGVGGIAIAFALKDSLENLLSSFMILMDKPFVIGDFIGINGVEGTVENVGFRSTQIRTMDNTLVSMPNRNLISNNLENFSERGSRRILAVVGAEYGLSVKQLETIIAKLKTNIDKNPNIASETNVYLDTFADSTININVVYYIKMKLDIPFQKVKEQINFEIYKIMYEYGTGFAFPTQTLITSSGVNNVLAAKTEENPST